MVTKKELDEARYKADKAADEANKTVAASVSGKDILETKEIDERIKASDRAKELEKQCRDLEKEYYSQNN